MKLPSVRSLAIALAPIKTVVKTEELLEFIEVRLQVDEDGDWRVHIGDPSYDDDHTGFWGYESIDVGSDLTIVAANMIEEVEDHLYIHGYKT